MKPTLITALSVILMMSGCERAQVNYDTPKVLLSDHTEELVWQGLGIVAMILVVGALSDTDRDALGL